MVLLLTLLAMLALITLNASARVITVYASTVECGGQWNNCAGARGAPETDCQKPANYARNEVMSSEQWVHVRGWQPFTLDPYEEVDGVFVDVNGRYDTGTSNNRFTLRALVNGEGVLQTSPTWTQSSADDNCRWRMGGEGWDITDEFASVFEWDQGLLESLELAVRRHPNSDPIGTSLARVNALRLAIYTTEYPHCVVTPEELNFGVVTTGVAVTSSFTILNDGSAALTGNVLLDPEYSDEGFSIVSGGGVYTLAPGASRVVAVRFLARTIGEQYCYIDCGSDCDVGVDLMAETVAPPCGVDPTEIFIDDTGPGVTDRGVTVTHLGTEGVLYGHARIDAGWCDPEFSIVANGGDFTLTPGQSRTITVRFVPLLAGEYGCWVVLNLGLESNECDEVLLAYGAYTSVHPPQQVPAGLIVRDSGLSTGTVCLRMSIAQPGGARVDVFDLRGRLVRRLYGGDVQVGTHELAWDGTDESGRRSPAAVYLVRMHQGTHRWTAKVGLVR